ncbi:hypothetical protein F5X68DRAFT_277273 [Plectosphaerella plurivora]|uniref:Uncharacterized protein n=1 Tax=Plectosphaerella plurivora TaxID=936078 RepID=A0A9P8V7K9_9PEZI|nr:hypothetical protein F5X68DRAFT_277273 [Plectosphaerella plurivora]
MVMPESSPAFLNPRPLRQTQLPGAPLPTLDRLDLTTEGAPKDSADTTDQDPPPAYTPPLRSRLQDDITALFGGNPALVQRLQSMPLPQPSSAPTDRVSSPDPDEEPYEELSPINLRISARINVARDNNVIALPYTPAEQAKSIAEAIVEAFKKGSISGDGIPMIDQEGRPRPIRIEVDAGITVEGANNVLGTEAAVMDIMNARHAVMRQRLASIGGGAFGGGAFGGGAFGGGAFGGAGPTVAGPSKTPSGVERRRSASAASDDEPPAKRRRSGEDS